MAERTIERGEPVIDDKNEQLRRAVDRADRAESELVKLKAQTHEQASSYPENGGPGHAPVQTNAGASAATDAGQHLVEPGSMDAARQTGAKSPEGHPVGEPQTHGLAALREDSMMAHLLDALGRGEDIGHYGRLTFAMIARHFLTEDEVLKELTKDRDFSDEDARQMLMQVEGRDYSPPRRDRILEWQSEQSFPIVPNPDDPDCGNVYRTLRFPKEIYGHIGHYQEEKAHS